MQIQRLNVEQDPSAARAIATVYQRAFAGPPWFEEFKCPSCSANFAGDMTVCPKCLQNGKHIPLVEYWTQTSILSDLFLHMRRPSAVLLVAIEQEEIVGFSWAYGYDCGEQFVSTLDAMDSGSKIAQQGTYLDECAIDPRYQGRGIGSKLFTAMCDIVRTDILMRTMRDNSPMFRIASELGFEVIEEISRGRVIMYRK